MFSYQILSTLECALGVAKGEAYNEDQHRDYDSALVVVREALAAVQKSVGADG